MAAKIIAETENMSYEEWLDFRKSGIGGSDVSVVCGINRYKSPVELWMEKPVDCLIRKPVNLPTGEQLSNQWFVRNLPSARALK